MAKAQATTAPEATETKPTETKATPKPGELKELFGKYEKANATVAAASAAYDKAMLERSKVVEAFSAFGKAFTAPNGERLKVIERTNKESGQKLFYFQGPGKVEALKIE
jgi:hypothetical protein